MTTLESAAEAIARPAVGFTRAQTLAVRLWAPLMFMGLILSAAAFVLGVINGLVAADYFAFSVAEREAAASGTGIVEKRIFIESVGAWLPELQFPRPRPGPHEHSSTLHHHPWQSPGVRRHGAAVPRRHRNTARPPDHRPALPPLHIGGSHRIGCGPRSGCSSGLDCLRILGPLHRR